MRLALRRAFVLQLLGPAGFEDVMATEFTMPKLGLTMEEATILEWLIADGQPVAAGTIVMRIETDKVETEVEISAEGVLHHVAQEGDVFPCGAVIAYVLSPGEDVPTPVAAAPAPLAAVPAVSLPPATVIAAAPMQGRLFASPNARRVALDRGVDLAGVVGTGPSGRIVSLDVTEHRVATVVPSVLNLSGVAATSDAAELADLLGVDLAEVRPDQPNGPVTRSAVAFHVRTRLSTPQVAAPSAAVTDAPLLQTPTRTIRLAGMRGTIAKRMHASLRDMAQLTLTMDADMNAVVSDRETRKRIGKAPSFTDYVVAAAARALAQHPNVNAQVVGDEIALLPDIHVGLAVALENGLIVPVVRHADHLRLDAIAVETSRLAEAARSGALAPTDLEGATFSVSTLGMFGVDAFTPVINPPNVAILGVGRIRDEVVAIDGAISIRKRVTLSLTWDHRVLDGAPAAAFCRSIVDALEKPSSIA
jgi:pyruvate dehydrogenase E2 component (dihydrolipoamide acetyltransferase)